MKRASISRRRFIGTASAFAAGSAAFGIHNILPLSPLPGHRKHVVSIVRIADGNVSKAVEEAVDLIGGIRSVTRGQDSIILKPNLVADSRDCTTKPEVIKALAQLMKHAGKEVMIAEGSAAAASFNVINNVQFRTKKREILDGMQQHVFDVLGYSDMAKSLGIPLINLHSGDITEVPLAHGFAAKSVRIHKSLTEADLICSVPMMKTHVLATVTLAMKNLIGLYPGTEYYSARAWLHEKAFEAGSTGVAYEVMDMNNAVKTGLSVIDASVAMEGNGPSGGPLVQMGLIIAGTSPLATDMVGATLMGFNPEEIPAIILAHKSGKTPASMADIEIRGLKPENCSRKFVRPFVYKWSDISKVWANQEI
jgi:uncharacterized protein (DUF362 family)